MYPPPPSFALPKIHAPELTFALREETGVREGMWRAGFGGRWIGIERIQRKPRMRAVAGQGKLKGFRVVGEDGGVAHLQDPRLGREPVHQSGPSES